MEKLAASLAAIVALTGFACSETPEEPPESGTVTGALSWDCDACPDPWVRPVCGEDGMTWPSECEATCNEVPIAFIGDCSCDCWGESDVVCGSDYETYPSPCSANCMGADVLAPGPCVCPECP